MCIFIVFLIQLSWKVSGETGKAEYSSVAKSLLIETGTGSYVDSRAIVEFDSIVLFHFIFVLKKYKITINK